MRDSPGNSEMERKLDRWAAAQSEAAISPELARKMRGRLAPSLAPVKPIPAPGWLASGFLGAAAAGAAGLIAILSKAGFHLMTGEQIGWMAVIFAGGAVLFSLALAHQMVPGSRPRPPMSLALALCGGGVLAGIALNFPWRMPAGFVSEGWRCGAMELTIAVPAAGIFWWFARRGALFASATLGATLAGLAALMVLAPLQVQCMFPQAPHLLVWHGGVAAVWIGIGALIGGRLHHRSIS